MMKKFFSLLIAAVAAMSLTSCLTDTDDEVTYYDDTAITAFSLGTINRYLHTTASDGSDSIYVKKITGSNYTCYIDQVNSLIYNPDSLPKGCDPAHVICTITTKNGGVVTLYKKNMWGQDSLAYYSSTDSIDFSNPVTMMVYSNSGKACKEYKVTLNVHQQTGNEFAWGYSTANGADMLGARRFAQLGETMWLFCQGNAQTVGYRLSDGQWQQATTINDADAYKSMTTLNGHLYTLVDGNVCSTTNGTDWSTLATPDGIKQLLGCSGARLYALTDNGIAYTTDGQTWTDDVLDSSNDCLPTTDLNLVALASKVNDNTNNLTLIGNRNGKTVVWTKVEENGKGADNAWTLLPDDSYNHRTLPALSGLQVVAYDDALLAMGGDSATFYTSQDHGLTWAATSIYALPIDTTTTATAAANAALFCNTENTLFYSKEQKTNVLTGRLARLGWKTEQTAFTK